MEVKVLKLYKLILILDINNDKILLTHNFFQWQSKKE